MKCRDDNATSPLPDKQLHAEQVIRDRGFDSVERLSTWSGGKAGLSGWTAPLGLDCAVLCNFRGQNPSKFTGNFPEIPGFERLLHCRI